MNEPSSREFVKIPPVAIARLTRADLGKIFDKWIRFGDFVFLACLRGSEIKVLKFLPSTCLVSRLSGCA